jgi:hypothetical protein
MRNRAGLLTEISAAIAEIIGKRDENFPISILRSAYQDVSFLADLHLNWCEASYFKVIHK